MPSRRRFLSAFGAAGVAAFAGCSAPGGEERSPPVYEQLSREVAWWPSPAHDPANSRYVPKPSGPSPPLSAAWSVPIGGLTRFPPLVGPETVLAVGGTEPETLVAVERDGSVRWRFEFEPGDDGGGPRLFAPPVLAGSSLGRVVVADESGTVRFLRRDEGRVVERVDLDGEVTAGPTTSNEAPQLAFVATRDGRVHAVDRMEGTVRWVHEAFGGVEHAPATGYPSLGRAALVVVPTTAGLVAVDDDGRGRWRGDLPWPAADRPTMAGDRVFVGATGGTLHAFDLHTGEPLWETRVVEDVPQGGFDCPIAATPDTLYVVSDDRVHAFDPSSGERRWQYVPDDRENRDGLLPPAALSDTLLVPRRGGLTALKPGGGVGLGALRVDPARWHADLEASVRTGTVAGGRFYALVTGEADGGDRLVAFE